MSRNAKILTAVIVISLALFVFVAPQYVNKIPGVHVPDVPFRLGLDLLGGAHLEYQADFTGLTDVSQPDAMQGIRDVVERRINFFGVAEPVVQVSGTDRLIVEIAGVTDVNQAIQLIGETPYLEFKDNGNATDLSSWQSTGLTGKDVKKASLTFNTQTSQPEVSLQLTDAGAKLFDEITKRDLGKPVAIFLDGAPISIPTVQSEISDGNAVISGNFTPTEAKTLATRLNSGALPVPIKLIAQQTVGSSLGAQSLSDSLKAGIWGLLLVALFMIIFYRLPGITAVLALGVYTLIVLAVYKALPVTLSLAGIAGFVLSLGMAVDANILIFARMKEELAAQRTLAQATHEGFSRAWLSIRDSHVTTLIGAVILYLFTTSIVRGFALTLGIGVVTSLITATVVTRAFLHASTGPWSQKHLWMFR
ncbi:MAG TPA: protein translocase subunit SecD [Candidatus Paceibacterota bacterium]|nr:protein translocase subunit SecD [Candidatus Paceibacterota bacterium]